MSLICGPIVVIRKSGIIKMTLSYAAERFIPKVSGKINACTLGKILIQKVDSSQYLAEEFSKSNQR